MPTNAEYEAMLAQAWTDLNGATNALGQRVQSLIDQINATPGEGLTGPQTEAVLTNLASLKTVLDGMGNVPSPPTPAFPTVR